MSLALFKGSIADIPTFTGIMDPAVAARLWEADCMWFDTFVISLDADAADNLHRIDADIRTRRQLQGQDRLFFVCSNAAAGVAVELRAMCRVLVKLKV